MNRLDPMKLLYQRRCAKFIYVVPFGLRELMSDISREVLRHQPENLCTFIADYLEALLITRENARVAKKLIDNVTESSMVVVTLLKELDISRQQADHAARIIQREFRRHIKRNKQTIDEQFMLDKLLEKLKISWEQACKAALIIQTAYRMFRQRLAQQDSNRIDWKLASKKTIGILKDITVPQFELERAATIIKAAYRGYYTRKYVKEILRLRSMKAEDLLKGLEGACKSPPSDYGEAESVHVEPVDYDDVMLEIQEHAATVIQRAYRKYIKKQKTKTAYTVPISEPVTDNDEDDINESGNGIAGEIKKVSPETMDQQETTDEVKETTDEVIENTEIQEAVETEEVEKLKDNEEDLVNKSDTDSNN